MCLIEKVNNQIYVYKIDDDGWKLVELGLPGKNMTWEHVITDYNNYKKLGNDSIWDILSPDDAFLELI